jgi:hypothetical protein
MFRTIPAALLARVPLRRRFRRLHDDDSGMSTVEYAKSSLYTPRGEGDQERTAGRAGGPDRALRPRTTAQVTRHRGQAVYVGRGVSSGLPGRERFSAHRAGSTGVSDRPSAVAPEQTGPP